MKIDLRFDGRIVCNCYSPLSLPTLHSILWSLVMLACIAAIISASAPDTFAVVSRTDAFRIVGLTNQQAPGFARGVVFRNRSGGSGFFEPVINNRGQVAFMARLAGTGINSDNESGIWLETDGVLSNVAQQGQLAPSIGVDAVLRFPYSPRLNDRGELSYAFSVEGSGVFAFNDTVLWFDDTTVGGSRQEIAREGLPAPGPPPGATFFRREGITESPVLNSQGDVAFWSEIDDPSSTSSLTNGIWLWRNQQLSVVGYTGLQAPGLTNVSFAGFSLPSLNDGGQIAFDSSFTGTGVNTSNNTGLWIKTGTQYELVARRGDAAPGLPGVTFDDLRDHQINDAGEVVFAADLEPSPTSSEGALWSTSNGGIHIVAREGDQAPGTSSGTTFSTNSYQFPVLNDRGETAFAGGLVGNDVDATNDTGIWIEREGSLQLLIREGDQIPDLSPGTVLDQSFFNPLMLNDIGHVAFLAKLRGPGVDNSNKLAVLATNSQGMIKTLVRTGDLIDTLTFGLHPISNIELFTDTSNADGKQSSFNDLGQLAIKFNVSGGNFGGILVSNLVAVPEPATTTLLIRLSSILLLSSRLHGIA